MPTNYKTKTKVATDYSLRAKFKNDTTVELVVIDYQTNEVYELNWDFMCPNITQTCIFVVKEEDFENMAHSDYELELRQSVLKQKGLIQACKLAIVNSKQLRHAAIPVEEDSSDD